MPMPGLMRALERGAVRHDEDDTMGPNHSSNANSNGWKTPAIAGLWALVLAFGGWAWNDADAARKEATAQIQRVDDSNRAALERIATLEEAMRNNRESLIRIEAGINEIRRDRK